MKKLTRKEISEGLKAVPMTQILLGSNQAGITLTKKQKTFAEEVVKTGNKSASYRKAYDHKGKPETASRDAQKVANNPKVSTYIQALEAAKEAETYLLPARLRTIAIHRLTGLALNEDIPPAQQLKALELIGKMTEVALFTERRELIQTSNSETMREQLLNSIRLAISSEGAEDVEAIEVSSLLDEISGAGHSGELSTDYAELDSVSDAGQQADQTSQTIDQDRPDPKAIQIQPDPLHPDPIFLSESELPPLHSIPHIESPTKTKNENKSQLNQVVSTVTPVTPRENPNTQEGEGVLISGQDGVSHTHGTPPVTNSNKNG